MYHYINAYDNSHLINDKTYNRIKENLDDFTTLFPLSKNKDLLLFEMVLKVYYKRHKAIKTKSESDTELLLSTLLATIIEQNLEIKKLEQDMP
jgi:hypothetical protein